MASEDPPNPAPFLPAEAAPLRHRAVAAAVADRVAERQPNSRAKSTLLWCCGSAGESGGAAHTLCRARFIETMVPPPPMDVVRSAYWVSRRCSARLTPPAPRPCAGRRRRWLLLAPP